jgi:hypothetical protein
VPVNPSNRFGDVVWAAATTYPRAPWVNEDGQGIVREFRWVRMADQNGQSVQTLVWRFPGDDVYRPWGRSVTA